MRDMVPQYNFETNCPEILKYSEKTYKFLEKFNNPSESDIINKNGQNILGETYSIDIRNDGSTLEDMNAVQTDTTEYIETKVDSYTIPYGKGICDDLLKSFTTDDSKTPMNYTLPAINKNII